jgi:hypothetical protein
MSCWKSHHSTDAVCLFFATHHPLFEQTPQIFGFSSNKAMLFTVDYMRFAVENQTLIIQENDNIPQDIRL